ATTTPQATSSIRGGLPGFIDVSSQDDSLAVALSTLQELGADTASICDSRTLATEYITSCKARKGSSPSDQPPASHPSVFFGSIQKLVEALAIKWTSATDLQTPLKLSWTLLSLMSRAAAATHHGTHEDVRSLLEESISLASVLSSFMPEAVQQSRLRKILNHGLHDVLHASI
ncbi:hypothetical protein HK405_002506, partial [Cladochytrium tenue]